MNHKNKRRMWTAMMLAGTMLTISLFSLGHRISYDIAVRAVAASEPYPNLFAPYSADFRAPENPTAYLTFDDGPSKNTVRILDILKEHHIKATFFVTLQHYEEDFAAEIFRRMLDEGHAIGLHSHSHKFGDIYKSLDAYLSDLNRLNDFIIEHTGHHPTLVRFPGGSKNRNASESVRLEIARELNRRGYVFHDWTVVSGDDGATAISADKIANNVISGIKNRQTEIILFHDNPTPTTTPDALLKIIPALRDMGYDFDRMTNSTPPTQFLKAE